MKPTTIPRVKICCISSLEEAKIAIECGASALGLVGNMPSGPGIIDDELIQRIAKSVPPPIATFLLTSETNAESIIAHYKKVNTSVIQIVDHLTDNGYLKIRNSLPHVKLVQVIHVMDEKAINQSIRISDFVDAILLDSGNPNLAIKELGGTGRVHNWEISREIREQVEVPIYLAGGLNQDNVGQAIETVRPFGLDLCSGVRTNGQLDKAKLVKFFSVISSAQHVK